MQQQQQQAASEPLVSPYLVRHLRHVRRAWFHRRILRKPGLWWESKTGLAVEHLIGGIECLVVILFLTGMGPKFVSLCVAFIYPTYASLASIESHAEEQQTSWLTYWTILAAFLSLEFFVDFFVWLCPFFYPLKIVFLVWLQHPKHKGAQVIYATLFRPFFSRFEHLVVAGTKDIQKHFFIRGARKKYV